MNLVRSVISTMIICALQNVYVNGWNASIASVYTSHLRNFFTQYKEACESLCTIRVVWDEQNGIVNELLGEFDDYGELKEGRNVETFKEIVKTKFEELRNNFVFLHEGEQAFIPQDNRIDFNIVSKQPIRNAVITFCNKINTASNDSIPPQYKYHGIIIRDYLKKEIYENELGLKGEEINDDCPPTAQ